MPTFAKNISQLPVSKLLGFNRNGCVAISLARAMADDPCDHKTVAEDAQAIIDMVDAGDLPGRFTWSGMYYGRCDDLWRAFGFEVEYCNTQVSGGRRTSRTRYPTAAQLFQDLPSGRYLVHATGHAAYVDGNVAYALTARKRVDYYVKLS